MSAIDELLQTIDRLRAPGGCPWDARQTLRSMRPHLLEECHEVLEAVDAGDAAAVRGELGDLLFNVLLMARIQRDAGDGGVQASAAAIDAKLRHRHPHVFGDQATDGSRPDAQARRLAWAEAKRAESDAPDTHSRMDGVPGSLPGLLRTDRQCAKAAADGFDWPDAESVLRKVEEEIAELREAMATGDTTAIEHEYGDALMAMASVGRHLRTPPEDALRVANNRFAARYRGMERIARSRGQRLSALGPDALEALWEDSKAAPLSDAPPRP
jgi:nucleoside triphosphate diphosphatase